jgi:AraC-like DNA-binding protein
MKNNGITHLDHSTDQEIYKDQFHIIYHKANSPMTGEPHRHNYHQVIWFPKANGIQCIDDVCFQMTGNDLFLLAEGQMHYFKNVEEMEGYILMFKDIFWEEPLKSIFYFKTSLFNNLMVNAHLQLSGTNADEITALMEIILKERKSDDYPGKIELIMSYLRILLIRISNFQLRGAIPVPHGNESDYLIFQQFIELLEKEYTEHRDVLFYTENLNITNRKLADICLKYNSRNPKNLIENRILIAAKRYLQFDSLVIKEIAEALNFSDQFQFSKFFKKLTGISPLEYRNQFQKS